MRGDCPEERNRGDILNCVGVLLDGLVVKYYRFPPKATQGIRNEMCFSLINCNSNSSHMSDHLGGQKLRLKYDLETNHSENVPKILVHNLKPYKLFENLWLEVRNRYFWNILGLVRFYTVLRLRRLKSILKNHKTL
jgi:hypothetical protein